MILLVLLTGVVAIFIWQHITGWAELVILTSWGLLAANTPIGHIPAMWLASLSASLAHLF